MEVFNSKNILDNVKVKSLSIGNSGKGKTFFCGTICDYKKPFFIDSEKGLLTIADKDFDYVTVNTFTEFGEAIQYYQKNYIEKGYDCLVIDSITRLQQYLATELCPDGKLTMNHWGEILMRLRKVINYVTKEIKTSVHVTAMAMESKDELSGMIKIFPNIQGSFKYDLSGYFDVVLYHDCGKNKEGKQAHWVHTVGNERITARSRLDSKNKMRNIEVNNYSIIENIINNKGEK